jgi:hypothetical protein
MDFIIPAYILLVIGIPILLIILAPIIYLIVLVRNRYRYKSAELKNMFIVEYTPPINLSPTELGYLFDENTNDSEIWSSLLTCSQKKDNPAEITDYEKQAKFIYEHAIYSKLFTSQTAHLFVNKETYAKYFLEIDKYKKLLRDSLVLKNLVISEEDESKKINKRRKKYSRLSKRITFFTILAPFSIIIFLVNYPDFQSIIIGILMLFGLSIIHSLMVYLSLMLNKYITDLGPVISLNNDKITRDVWDELRGYRDFLRKVEAPRAKTYLKQKDTNYLTSERFSQLVAFNFISKKLAREAYELIR